MALQKNGVIHKIATATRTMDEIRKKEYHIKDRRTRSKRI
jgi:hypothetical protein